MVREINHIGLLTKDIEASRRFYVELLGGVVIRQFINDQGKTQFLYVQLALGVIELIQVSPESTNTGYAHIAFLIDRAHTLDEYYETLAAQGYEFTSKPRVANSGNGRLAFFLEDSGCQFELIEREENIRIRDHRSEKLSAFRWFGISTTQEKLEKSGKFYENVLGLTPVGNRAGGISCYNKGEDSIALLPSTGSEKKVLSCICFEAHDCGTLKQTLVDSGISCSAMQEKNGERYFEALDPDGEKLIFVQKK